MAIYNHVSDPEEWSEFQKRCEQRISKIRETKDQGLFAGMYANDVGLLLALLLGMTNEQKTELYKSIAK